MYAFEALSCLSETPTYKNFEKTLFFLQDIKKSKSKIAFLSLKSIFSSALTSLTWSRQYLFLKRPISESEAGNPIRAINRNTKVAIRSTVDPNAIFNTKNPGNIPISAICKNMVVYFISNRNTYLKTS